MPGSRSEDCYRDYDRLAWFYDRHWGEAYHRQAFAAIERLAGTLRAETAVLDLCCGAGHLTRMLADRGCRITGLDGSEEMLRFAAQRVPGAEFVAADARSFRLRPRFALAVSTFESMNHIPTLAELEVVFRNVADALIPGGRFVFDILTEETYRYEWSKPSTVVEDDNACFVRGGYDPETQVAHVDITAFRRGDAWERSDIRIQETYYPEEDVREALQRAGLPAAESLVSDGRIFLCASRG